MKPLSLYIHIPFCARKCAYCDFASWPGLEARWADYFRALAQEIAAWSERLREYTVATVFFGGGTPSLPDAGYIVRLQEYMFRYRTITKQKNTGSTDGRCACVVTGLT